MATSDCDRIRRGYTEHIVKTSVVCMVFDTMQCRLDAAATSMSEASKTAKVPNDFVVDGDDVVEVQQVNDPSMQSARLDVPK